MSSPAPIPAITAGRLLLSLVALLTSIGCYIADWNETHVKNPNWPPHARFHNGQTMSMGLSLGLLTMYFAWRPVLVKEKGIGERQCITIAAVLGSLYYVTGMSGILYPGAKWLDPEFGEGAPQVRIFVGVAGMAWAGWGLEMRRLAAERKVKRV
ncbi:uncharacterized protein Z520_04905 [Fonsecaea multimorphosa CBS 102226]|uniref:Acetyltransferase n=1 Tax=Fonsecaea multimorphosa CBS 102226 TaxID=1442371 RepID=A0A0D2K865_9EURO|nr:uncharacterized protein Z520_04905 [Fonsecaea multimorphosa CBS 102226]KIX99329.1 hypothetical protein Z520_04905 [Fonsecaea multimorphosa CBS 102226]OAL25659.1 hypothetical protein AYO22_04648 [Fonsecaea multimorphosa]